MPKKKVEEVKVEEVKDNKKEEEKEEDSAVVKALKAVDDKYCAIEVEFEREAQKLRTKFKADQAHLVEERVKVLSAGETDKEFGTPACKGFWLQAFQNSDEFAECLQEYDEPVLEYLENIKCSDTDPVYEKRGTKLDFIFKENPFFTNTVLTIEVIYDYDPESYKPWMELECKEVKSTPIDWKAGKNVTVELTQKKVKGGGAKKAKKKGQSKEEPRPSFFRVPFCNLKVGEPFPEALAFMLNKEDEDDEDDDEVVKMFLCQLSEMCEVIDEGIHKYAVRFYTGEAGENDDDDMSEEGESEDDDDDDEDSDDSEDGPPARGKAGAKAKANSSKKAAGGKPDGADGKKEEECKQQ